MDTLVTPTFIDENAEFTALQAGTIDLTDWPLTPSLVTSLTSDPNFYVTPPISATEYFELEYHLGSNFWGCNMNFGGSACGKDIRQGIAHLLDKNIFTTTQADIAGLSIPVDSPVPPSVGLVSANPCAWDQTHLESGSNCKVGAPGGTAYHLAAATGVNFPWQPALGTPDFCAAADHFISAGLASGKDPTTCQLTGLSSSVNSVPVNMFARSDHNPRLEIGESIVQELCALFTGSFTTGCTPVTVTQGPITAFPGFTTSPTTIEQDWNMYTAGFSNVLTFDSSLFFGYHSQFVSGIASIKPPNGPCSSLSVGSFSAANYMYLCSPAFDAKASQMEFSPCLSAPGDPVNGQVTPTFANCPSTSKPTAISSAYQAEDIFGQNSFTLPIYSGKNQYAYSSLWQRVANHAGNGLLNYFATLDAWSPSPPQAGTIRQGLKQTTQSLNPYIASTVWDFAIIGNIWDTLNTVNPEANGQLLDWMTISTQVLSNAQLTYTPPSGTLETFRFSLRNDIFWQDGRKLTAYDVAFTYLTLKATGAFQSTGLAPMLGVKVLSPSQIDVNVNAVGPFTRLFLATPTIFPGRYWSSQCPGAIWDGNLATGKIPDRCMTVDSAKILPTFDPLAAGIMVGQGPWVCKSSGGVIGLGCSSTGSQNPSPGGTYTLTRNGLGTAPGASLQTFFRSSGNLALYIWTGDTGDFNHDFLNFGVVSLCFGQSLLPLGTTTGCGHWQQGIGAPTGHSTVTGIQVGIVQRFVGVNWVSPYDWVSSPPQGIASFPPVLYEGTVTLNPAIVAGCASAYPNSGYDC